MHSPLVINKANEKKNEQVNLFHQRISQTADQNKLELSDAAPLPISAICFPTYDNHNNNIIDFDYV